MLPGWCATGIDIEFRVARSSARITPSNQRFTGAVGSGALGTPSPWKLFTNIPVRSGGGCTSSRRNPGPDDGGTTGEMDRVASLSARLQVVAPIDDAHPRPMAPLHAM